MQSCKRGIRGKTAALLCAAGFLGQFGGCEFGEISTTVTMDTRELIIGVVRGTILTPLDEFITDAVNEAFDENDR